MIFLVKTEFIDSENNRRVFVGEEIEISSERASSLRSIGVQLDFIEGEELPVDSLATDLTEDPIGDPVTDLIDETATIPDVTEKAVSSRGNRRT